MNEDEILDDFRTKKKKYYFHILAILSFPILIGVILGGILNFINACISPIYFDTIVGTPPYFTPISFASLLGISDGLAYGIFYAVIYTPAFYYITKMDTGFLFAAKQILNSMKIIILTWLAFGIGASILLLIFPDLYRSIIIGVPPNNFAAIKYAFTGGAIWGSIIGSLFALIHAIYHTRKSWRNENQSE